jgi:hypothetical protein
MTDRGSFAESLKMNIAPMIIVSSMLKLTPGRVETLS